MTSFEKSNSLTISVVLISPKTLIFEFRLKSPHKATQLRKDNDELKQKLAEMEEQLNKERKMRNATDQAFKTETKRLRDNIKQMKHRGRSLDSRNSINS